MLFEPEPLPIDTQDRALGEFIIRELRRIAAGFLAVEGIQLPVLHVEPTRPRNGMVVLADGTDWNPGSGAGFYGRSGGTWTFLG